jgi:dTMP kinase
LDRLERESEEFFLQVRQAYLRLAEREPERICRVDASAGLEQVQREIQTILRERLGL